MEILVRERIILLLLEDTMLIITDTSAEMELASQDMALPMAFMVNTIPLLMDLSAGKFLVMISPFEVMALGRRVSSATIMIAIAAKEEFTQSERYTVFLQEIPLAEQQVLIILHISAIATRIPRTIATGFMPADWIMQGIFSGM